ncbi:hypothetical protein ACFVAJ_18130 [Agromyces sp. NPDC057679]|uniref:hypothetical protein n=1 Tax=Agromyces sp. NPDC057679 TaxID=3346207 RepID=UPI00366D204F
MSRHTFEAETLEAAKQKVREAFPGGGVTVVSADRVGRPAGVPGFTKQLFAKPRYEIVVDVEDELVPAHLFAEDSSGLYALLTAEDAADGHDPEPARDPFGAVIGNLHALADLDDEPASVSPLEPAGFEQLFTSRAELLARTVQVPVISKRAGDLVVVVGRPDDAVQAVKALSRSGRYAELRPAGSAALRGAEPVSDRRGALTARAAAVERDRPVYVAYGAGIGGTVDLDDISPDQLWLAVDASAKPDDTAAWAAPLIRRYDVEGLIVSGVSATLSPATVNLLNVPVGYVDGKPADAPRL